MPLPDQLPIMRGAAQSDPYLAIRSRMRGLPPGNPDDFLDPTNPKTKVSMVIADLSLTLGVDCPANIAYIPSTDEPGAYDVPFPFHLGFGSFPVDQVGGKQGTVTIDVVGNNGVGAHAEKTVVLVLPAGSGPDAGIDAVSAVDGPVDAAPDGAVDAPPDSSIDAP